MTNPYRDVGIDKALRSWDDLSHPLGQLVNGLSTLLSPLPPDTTLTISSAETISPSLADSAFRLVEQNLKQSYIDAPSFGWDEASKRAEMLEKPTRYLLLLRGGSLVAFLSTQLVDEDGPVLYCYELQVTAAAQGQKLGSWLMKLFHLLASELGVCRTMLTCFTSNKRALAFYKALGYVLNDTSPRPRRLRNKTVEPDYEILSKAC